MSILTETLGPNSYRIEYDTLSEGQNGLLAAIVSAVTGAAHGWEVHHDTSPGAGGTKVIKSLCEDQSTYKFVRLSSNGSNIYLEVGDGSTDGSTSMQNIASYDPATAQNHSPASFQQVVSEHSAMYVFVSPRYIILFAEKRNSSGYVSYGNAYGTWTGCLEFRDDLGQFGAPFAWTDGYHFSGRVGDDDDNNDDHPWKTWCFSLPRTGTGSTNNEFRYEGTSIGHIMNSLINYYHYSYTSRSCNSGSYNWTYNYYYDGDASEKNALSKTNTQHRPMTIVPHAIEHRSTQQIRGPFFGLKKALGGYGVILSVLSVKADASFFPSKKGTLQDHMIIGSAYDRYLIPL
jgi:hypothetical protein